MKNSRDTLVPIELTLWNWLGEHGWEPVEILGRKFWSKHKIMLPLDMAIEYERTRFSIKSDSVFSK